MGDRTLSAREVAVPTDARVWLIRADNPSPMTLNGTNSWVVEVAGAVWVVDPGPDEEEHVSRLVAIAHELGTPAGVALTHDHLDHSEAVEVVAATLGGVPVLRHGNVVDSPFEVLHTPGHAADHLVFWLGEADQIALFSGDLVLGQSSTIVPPGGGTLIAYLESLKRVGAIGPALILPGHGEPIEDAAAAVVAQREHRLRREADLRDALAERVYDREALLDRVWSDVPESLRIAAHVTMQSHLEKLDLENELPEDFETEGRKTWQHRG